MNIEIKFKKIGKIQEPKLHAIPRFRRVSLAVHIGDHLRSNFGDHLRSGIICGAAQNSQLAIGPGESQRSIKFE